MRKENEDDLMEVYVYEKDTDKELLACNMPERGGIKVVKAVTQAVEFWEKRNDQELKKLRSECDRMVQNLII